MVTAKKFRIIVCMGLFLGLFTQPRPVSACSCAETGSSSQEFKKSHAVFAGKVLRIADEYFPVFSTFDSILTALGRQPYFWAKSGRYVGYRVYFDVSQSWKGITESSAIVDTGYGMGDCGYSFTVNNDYLVYASFPYGMPANYWTTTICSRNAEINAATQDLNYLQTLPTLPLQPSLQRLIIMFSKFAPILLLILITLAISIYAYKGATQD